MNQNLPIQKFPSLFPGQWGIPGSDSPLGLRQSPNAKVFYVSSTHGAASNSNDGTDPNFPLAQWARAIVLAAAGDWIKIAPKHVENLATAGAVTLNLAGLVVIGEGEGADRPTFTMTAAAGSVIFSSPSCWLENVLFICTAASTIVLDVNTTNTRLVNVEIREGAAATFVNAIDITGAGANATDRTQILGCKIVSNMVGATNGILIAAVNEGMVIQGNWIQGDFSGAGIFSASVLTNALVDKNTVANMNAADFAIELTAAATGMLTDNRLYSDAIATCLDPGSMKCSGNLASISIDTAGVPIPVVLASPMGAGSINAATFAADAITAAVIAPAAIDLATFAAGALGTSILPVERSIEKANGEFLAGQDDLFVITGGPIKVISFVGIVTVATDGAATIRIDEAVTAPAADIALSTAVALANPCTIGTSITFSAAFPAVLLPTPAGAIGAIAEPAWVCPIGTIKMNSTAARAGTVRWFMSYKPLSPLSVVVAAA